MRTIVHNPIFQITGLFRYGRQTVISTQQHYSNISRLGPSAHDARMQVPAPIRFSRHRQTVVSHLQHCLVTGDLR